MDYPSIRLFIDGKWIEQAGDPVVDPATEEVIGEVPRATLPQLDEAVAAAERGFRIWRTMSPAKRGDIIRNAANLLRQRAREIAQVITLEQGKPLADAENEVLRGSELIAWDAEEGRRTFGRVIPSEPAFHQMVVREPIGPVAAFTPWSAPTSSAGRKLGGALAAGCSVVLKASEETPAGACALVKCFEDAGLPAGVVNLVFGNPDEISRHLIAAPAIRLLTFTGSVPVGIHLAKLAAAVMKPTVMELGGHSPAIVCKDADPKAAAKLSASAKFRNAGQVCISPTRFLVHDSLFDDFADEFVARTSAIKVGNGFDPATQMGPLANGRRLAAMEEFVGDAVRNGGKVRVGGERIGNRGYFFQPTVLTDVPKHCSVMNVEPFGPLALLMRFHDLPEAVEEANRLSYGLAAYALTNDSSAAAQLSSQIGVGHFAVNHFGGGIPESPFGGVKQSGLGREGGSEGLEGYQTVKYISQHIARP
ncbi:MAG: NAD-dependent succinate-semialdehyde dehydrogenase [Pseudorhodoplanes sp.]|uniref:NAD-dependent succinate-semialdehyde dehydrogenase n=1 Tax=Pseudorhodoplanes sp. TaxID=1934341 RepID=UPI003D144F86